MHRLHIVAILALLSVSWAGAGRASWLQSTAGQNTYRPQGLQPEGAQTKDLPDLVFSMRLNPGAVEWFNRTARPKDIASFNARDLLNNPDILDQVTAGRKMLVAPSIAQAEELLPAVAGQIDILGYNLEHWENTPAEEKENPVAAVQRFQALADEHHLELAVGPDRRFAADYGAEMAPYADLFVLQLQRLQADVEAMREFSDPLFKSLREANPALQIMVQLRPEGTGDELLSLIDSLKSDIDGVAILTNAASAEVTQDVVKRMQAGGPLVAPTSGPSGPLDRPPDVAPTWTPLPMPEPELPAARILWRGALLIAGAACGGLLLLAGLLFAVLWLVGRRRNRNGAPPGDENTS